MVISGAASLPAASILRLWAPVNSVASRSSGTTATGSRWTGWRVARAVLSIGWLQFLAAISSAVPAEKGRLERDASSWP